MHPIVVAGKKSDFEEYLDGFIKDHAISHDSIYKFESVKIGDAREIKRIFARRAENKRLVVLGGKITREAQNALLKSLEEMPRDTYALISVERADELLLTILSRSKLVRISGKNSKTDLKNGLYDSYFSSPNLTSAFLISEYIAKEEKTDDFFFYVHEKIKNDVSVSHHLLSVANLIYENIQLVNNNNLNVRFLLEAVLASNSKRLDKRV